MKTAESVTAICLAGLLAASFQALAAQTGPTSAAVNAGGFTNADFELGTPGGPLPGWSVPKILADQGFSAVLTTNRPSHGKQCVEVRWPKERTPAANLFANLLQRVDAAPLRAKRIKVTAAIRMVSEKPNGRAQMWLRVDRPGGVGAFDNMNDRPVVSRDWADYSITVDVADDALAITLGLMTFEGATAGTNGNINQRDLPLGYRMFWTGMQVLKHDGSRHHGVGIIPTVKVSKSMRGIRQGRDEQLERALALLP